MGRRSDTHQHAGMMVLSFRQEQHDMPRSLQGSLSDADGKLPKNQPLIQTSGVKRLFRILDGVLLSEPETGYSGMAIVTGGAGIGKSVTVQYYMDQMKPLAHTGLPAGLLMKVGPRSTPRALAKSIVERLEGRARGRNTTELADEAAEAILAYDLKLFTYDECNRLNEESFDVLRHIHDCTGCPIVLVGLPTLLKVIQSQRQFDSRVGKREVFRPLTRQEVLTTVLPQLVMPYWQYNPEHPEDLAMGTDLVKRAGPSWRKLRVALQNASQIAKRRKAERITPAILHESYRMAGMKPQQEEEPVSPDEQSGEYEAESEDRHEGKAQSKPNN